MTPEKQALLTKLNAKAETDYGEAVARAQRTGKPAPAAPAPMALDALEFPKWLYRGWKESETPPGYCTAAESKLALTADEAKALEAKGFSEAPTSEKADTKPDAPKAKAASLKSLSEKE